ncbi:MAG: hypothetical protein D6737_15335, partial [Chloroflexi bacterium]
LMIPSSFQLRHFEPILRKSYIVFITDFACQFSLGLTQFNETGVFFVGAQRVVPLYFILAERGPGSEVGKHSSLT